MADVVTESKRPTLRGRGLPTWVKVAGFAIPFACAAAGVRLLTYGPPTNHMLTRAGVLVLVMAAGWAITSYWAFFGRAAGAEGDNELPPSAGI